MIHKIPNWLVICIVVRLCLIFVHCGDDDNKNNGKKKEDKEE